MTPSISIFSHRFFKVHVLYYTCADYLGINYSLSINLGVRKFDYGLGI
jgi:hypothetical protein